MFKQSQSIQKPTALGVMLQASTYGQTVPVIYGRAKSTVLLTWLDHLRKGDSGKKKKKAGKKGSPPTYVAAADLLIGTNPILGCLAAWNNNEKKYDLEYGVAMFTGNYLSDSVAISDPNFYSVIAVTVEQDYDVTFDDYAGPGSTHLTGTFEVPLVNSYVLGPDPCQPPSFRYWPYCYRWNNTLGPTIYIERFDSGLNDFHGRIIRVYYARFKSRSLFSGPTIPLARLRLTFEPELGDGSEYDGFEDKQIIYPMFSGVGSPNLDLGSGAVAPKINLEIQGKYGLHTTGDCFFPDIIEDVIRSGVLQAGYTSAKSITKTQHGSSCYEWPAVVQQRYAQAFEDVLGLGVKPLVLGSPLEAGDVIFVYDIGRDGAPSDPATPTDSTSGALTWNLIHRDTITGTSGTSTWPYGLWYSTVPSDLPAGVTITSSNGNYGHTFAVAVLRGDDIEFDNAVVTAFRASGEPLASPITTTQDGSKDAFIIAWYALNRDAQIADLSDWKPFFYSDQNNDAFVPAALIRRVTQPGTYSLPQLHFSGSAELAVVLVAFKSTSPRTVANPVGNIIDEESIQLTRNQCRAYGLFGSLAMTQQKQASEWLKMMGDADDESQGPGNKGAANCAYVWSGSKLKVIPWAEASAVGGGVTYLSPIADGPVVDFDVAKGDFVFKENELPIQIEYLPQGEDGTGSPQPTVFQAQIYPRSGDYNQCVISQPLAGAVAMRGAIKESPQSVECITDVTVGRKYLTVRAKCAQLDRVRFHFTWDARASLFEAMDVPATITWREAGIVQMPIRVLSMEEGDDHTWKVTAGRYIYGMCTPDDVTGTDPTGSGGDRDVDPGSVNPPIIFQPVAQLLDNQAQPQVWFVVSAESEHYGGCFVWISTDGGTSYVALGAINGGATTGYLLEDWPAATDPDSTNELLLDLSESRGELASYGVTDENNFVYPFYVDGAGTGIEIQNAGTSIAVLGGMQSAGVDIADNVQEIQSGGTAIADATMLGSGSPPTIVYELGTYSEADLISTYEWRIPVGGNASPISPDPYIRRSVFGAPGTGVDHPVNSRFAMLDPSGEGILKVNLDSRWIGVPLKFKFLAFNEFGAGLQSLADVPAYDYTPISQGLSSNPWGGF